MQYIALLKHLYTKYFKPKIYVTPKIIRIKTDYESFFMLHTALNTI